MAGPRIVSVVMWEDIEAMVCRECGNKDAVSYVRLTSGLRYCSICWPRVRAEIEKDPAKPAPKGGGGKGGPPPVPAVGGPGDPPPW